MLLCAVPLRASQQQPFCSPREGTRTRKEATEEKEGTRGEEEGGDEKKRGESNGTKSNKNIHAHATVMERWECI